MGDSRVDLQHLLERLRDTGSAALEATILTELAACALDAGASCIRFHPSAADATLTVVDDGRGMQRRELARQHRMVATPASRRESIGLPGAGIRLGLLVAREIVTETRRGQLHIATTCHLATRYRAPWKWIPPPGLTDDRGTAVRMRLNTPLSPLLDPGYLEGALRHHFGPLLDAAFDDVLKPHYPGGVAFEVGGRRVLPLPNGRERVAIPIRLGRRRLPSAIAIVERHTVPLPEDQHGLAVSTRGRVIKAGWDWLGLTPIAPFRVGGIVEAPELAACLTAARNDFVRSGPRGATYAAFRKAIKEGVARQLTAWGDARDDGQPRAMRLERDLERVVAELAAEFPHLRSLAEEQAGGQKHLPLPGMSSSGNPATLAERPRYGLRVHFESREGDTDLARLAGRTIWINEGHAAYARASASRATGYHIAVSVAVALAPMGARGERERGFVSRFLAHWGNRGDAAKARKAKRAAS